MSHARHRDLSLPGTIVTETLPPPGGRIIQQFQEPGGAVTTLRGPPYEELTRGSNGIWTLRTPTPPTYVQNWPETTQATLPPMTYPRQDYQLQPMSRYTDQTYLPPQSGTSGRYPPQINRPQQQRFQSNSGAYSAFPPPTAGSSAAYQSRPTTSSHPTTPSDVYACRLCKSYHEKGINVKCEISKNSSEQSVNGTLCCQTCYAQSKNGLDDYKGCNPAGRKYNKKGGKSKGIIEIGTFGYETG